jgi:hypothetical protein
MHSRRCFRFSLGIILAVIDFCRFSDSQIQVLFSTPNNGVVGKKRVYCRVFSGIINYKFYLVKPKII